MNLKPGQRPLQLAWLMGAICGCMASAFASAQITRIAPVHVVSPVSGEILHNRAVLIQDGRIRKIAPAGLDTTSQPSDMTDQDANTVVTVDGGDGYLIPGLYEMHAHVPARGRGEQYARDVMTLFLANGVTTIRGMLGEAWHLELRELLEQQKWPGPHLVTSGPSFNGDSVTSTAQAERRVLAQAAAGYDFLKLHPGLTANEFAAIAAMAKSLGIPFAGHVSVDVGLDAALEANQASIDHLDGYAGLMVPATSDLYGAPPTFFGINLAPALNLDMARDLAVRTADAGVWNVPTQSLLENMYGDTPVENLLARPGMKYLSVELRNSWIVAVERARNGASESNRRLFVDARRKLLYELQQAGAGLLLGSDSPQIMNVPGFSIHEELEFLVLAGLSPLQALRSGTVNPAIFFGYADRGQIDEGQLADLVLLESNPLEDISATRGILGVMRGGSWYSRSQLDVMLADITNRGL